MSDMQKLIQGKIKTVSRAYSVAILTIEIDSQLTIVAGEIVSVFNVFGLKFQIPFIILIKKFNSERPYCWEIIKRLSSIWLFILK